MKPSPFIEVGGLATLRNTQSIFLACNGEPACNDYRPVGLDILGDRTITHKQFMRELRARHEGHWMTGVYAYGFAGYSRDVAREHPLNEGETH